MALRVRIKGARHIVENLDEMEKKIIKATQKAMVKTALVDIESVAKRKITTDGHIDTGRLRASIHTEYGNIRQHIYQDDIGNTFVGSLGVNPIQGFQILVGTDVNYAIYVEDMDSFLFYAYNKGIRKMPKNIKKEVKKVLRGG